MSETDNQKEPDHVLTVRVPKEWRKALRKKAADEDTTVAELLRGWIRTHLQPEEGSKGGLAYGTPNFGSMLVADRK